MSSGYSGTPLAKKLGIKPGMSFVLSNEPDHYIDLFEYWPEETIHINNPKSDSIDFIHLFCKDYESLNKLYSLYMPTLKKTGLMWISWPKKSSKVKTDINSNAVRTHILENGLVDVKVASIDDTWSALKAVYRLKDR